MSAHYFQQSSTLLSLYHTISTFNDPAKIVFRKHCGKMRKCWLPASSPFPTMFSVHRKKKFSFRVTFILLSANVFNLDQSEISSFGTGKEENAGN